MFAYNKWNEQWNENNKLWIFIKKFAYDEKYKMNVLFLVISPSFKYLHFIAQFDCHT